MKRAAPPLKNMEFVFIGKTETPKEDLKKMIVKLGGKVGSKVNEKVAAVIGTKEDIEKMGSKMQTAKELGIQVTKIFFIMLVIIFNIFNMYFNFGRSFLNLTSMISKMVVP